MVCALGCTFGRHDQYNHNPAKPTCFQIKLKSILSPYELSCKMPNNVGHFSSILCALFFCEKNLIRFFLFKCHYSHCTVLSCMSYCVAAMNIKHHLFVQMLQLIPCKRLHIFNSNKNYI